MKTREKNNLVLNEDNGNDQKDTNQLLAMWVTCVEQASVISQRRDTMTNWFMVLQGGLITGIISLLSITKSYSFYIILLICLLGIILNIVWIRLINNFRYLNEAKYDVIDKLENQLPSKPLYDEWIYTKRKKDYRLQTQLELAFPTTFLIINTLAFLGMCIYILYNEVLWNLWHTLPSPWNILATIGVLFLVVIILWMIGDARVKGKF